MSDDPANVSVASRLTRGYSERLEAAAEELGVSRSTYIRLSIEYALDQNHAMLTLPDGHPFWKAANGR